MQDTLQNISLLLLHLSKMVHSSLICAIAYVATNPQSKPARKESGVLLAPLLLVRVQILQEIKGLAQGHLDQTKCELRLECGSFDLISCYFFSIL